MAIYHLSMKNGAKGKGGKHASYISGEDKYEHKNDVVEKLEMNIPDSTTSAKSFFRAADKFERKNGRVYKEIEVSLARELSPEQNKQAVLDFIENSPIKGKPTLVAIHAGKSGNQPHAHIMFSERPSADLKMTEFFKRTGSKKDRTLNAKRCMPVMRQSWENSLNTQLQKAGLSARVSAKTLRAQGISRIPQLKIGPAAYAIKNRGEKSTRFERVESIKQKNFDSSMNVGCFKDFMRQHMRERDRILSTYKSEPIPLEPTFFKKIMPSVNREYEQKVNVYNDKVKCWKGELAEIDKKIYSVFGCEASEVRGKYQELLVKVPNFEDARIREIEEAKREANLKEWQAKNEAAKLVRAEAKIAYEQRKNPNVFSNAKAYDALDIHEKLEIDAQRARQMRAEQKAEAKEQGLSLGMKR